MKSFTMCCLLMLQYHLSANHVNIHIYLILFIHLFLYHELAKCITIVVKLPSWQCHDPSMMLQVSHHIVHSCTHMQEM